MTEPEPAETSVIGPDTSEYVVTIDQDLNYTFLLTEEHAAALPPEANATPVPGTEPQQEE